MWTNSSQVNFQFHKSVAMIWSFAIETSGVFGPVASTILCDLAHQIKDVSKEPHSRAYLFQKISVAVQRGMQHLSWVVLV